MKGSWELEYFLVNEGLNDSSSPPVPPHPTLSSRCHNCTWLCRCLFLLPSRGFHVLLIWAGTATSSQSSCVTQGSLLPFDFMRLRPPDHPHCWAITGLFLLFLLISDSHITAAVLIFIYLFFLPVLWRYNSHMALYKFKVYSVMI